MQPEEIGHAAAYQAYRSWLQNGSMYDVLGDSERQREGLVGIAVAEGQAHLDNVVIIGLSSAVTRLLQHSVRPMDRYSQSLAAEAAAQTVTGLFYQVCRRFSSVRLDTTQLLGAR
jgi:hypothetical protein